MYNVIPWCVRANQCCYGKETMRSLCIVHIHVAVNNTLPLVSAKEKQEWVPLALLASYKIFRSALNNINVLRSSCKVPDNFIRL